MTTPNESAPAGDCVLVPREAVAQAAAALDIAGRRELAAWLMRSDAIAPGGDCKHDPYQGACAHCGVEFRNGVPVDDCGMSPVPFQQHEDACNRIGALEDALQAILHTYDDGGVPLTQAFAMANAALDGCTHIPGALELAAELAAAESRYRHAHDHHGDGSMEAGRAWDRMRRAGIAMTDYLAKHRATASLPAAGNAGAVDDAAYQRLFHRRFHVPEGEARDEYVADLRALAPAAGECKTCKGYGFIPYQSGQTPETFEQGTYDCPDCVPADPSAADDYRQIAHLIGCIFYYGGFKAETYNERELERLLRKVGNFYETEAALLAAQEAKTNG